MIRINLLGDSTKIDYTNRYIVFASIISFLLMSFLCYNLYYNATVEVKQLTLKSESLQEKLTRLEQKTKVVRELEKKKEVLREKLLLLAKLRKNKIGPVKVLDDLNISLPETIWVREVSESNGSVSIIGRALDNQNIALFIKQLVESDYFITVDLVESRQVYYSKKTGQVSSTPDVTSRGQVGSEDRVTKNKSFSSVRQNSKVRKGQISENNIRIKEFSLKAEINFAGGFDSATREIEVEEEIQFPELKQIENL